MKASQDAQPIYYFNNSKMGRWLANLSLRFIRMRIERVKFSQGDMRDQDGNLIWLKTTKDTLSIQEEIKNNAEFQKAVGSCGMANSLHLFLGKWAMCCDSITTDVFLMLKFIFFIRIVEHRENLNDPMRTSQRDVFLFMQARPWFVEIERFAQSKGINIIPARNIQLHLKAFFLRFDSLKSFIKEFCKKTSYYWMVTQYKLKELIFLRRSNNVQGAHDFIKNKGNDSGRSQLRIAIEHYGYLNFDSPELFSDLFFFQKSSLRAQDILVYFGLSNAPITDKEWSELSKRGIFAIAINPQAAATPDVPIFNHKRGTIKIDWFKSTARDKKNIFTHNWLCQHILNYHQRYNYWVDFITQHRVKIHVTWFKYSPDHCAILDALQNLGGVGVVYQRSFDPFLAPGTFTTADVVFGFSKLGAHIGEDKHSIIPYYVVSGYLGDYRFSLLQKRSNDVRNLLRSHGAQRILAYFDEHATNHPQWDLAYKVTIRNYSYLLNKVLENPWFGLILKPKVPSTLRSKRLGSVWELLHQAEKTGRCFIFEDTNLQSSFPPAAASLGADIAIHGHLFAATAGVESALTGTPTLLLDCEGISDSPLRILGERVIFKDIEPLWRSCVEHWNRPGGIPGFADWSGILDQLDPFRDGRAAERMGIYLEWLIEGFKAGLPRETVLADAAERYARIWGKDKILSVNCPKKMEGLAKIA